MSSIPPMAAVPITQFVPVATNLPKMNQFERGPNENTSSVVQPASSTGGTSVGGSDAGGLSMTA